MVYSITAAVPADRCILVLRFWFDYCFIIELPRVLERAAKGPAAAQGVGSASATTESATAIAAEHAAAALRAAATTATIAAAGSIRRQRRTDTKAKGAWREYTTATRAATEEGFSEEAVEIATAVAAVEEGAR